MKTPRHLIPLCLFASLCGAFCTTGCDAGDDDEDTPPQAAQQTDGATQRQVSNDAEETAAADATNIELLTLTEPKEGAFTIGMPKGWRNQVALVRAFDQTRTVATALHPGGDTLLFFGDPKMPTFYEAQPDFDANNTVTRMNPMIQFASYQSAAPFFTVYLKEKFGSKSGFHITDTSANPILAEKLRERAREYNLQPKISTTLIAFDYKDKGKQIHVLVNGMTMKIGTIWLADLSGVSTTSDPQAYNDLVMRIASSHRANKQWQARESRRSAAEHKRRMAMIENNGRILTLRHEQNMAWIHNSSAQHQARMDAPHAAGDAQMAYWQAQQASQEVGHQQFLNTIKGEETVVGSGGQEYQVQSGAGRYYRNTNNNTFVGTHSTMDHGDLRSAWGLNPDDYEEVKIKRH